MNHLLGPISGHSTWKGGQVHEGRLQTQSQRGVPAGTGGVGHAWSPLPQAEEDE